ncbi:hypothetical protein EDD17DRAFT_865017 [Pisolithus thermaeus]|nr:hypothetical protein EDD17DRAFT_865017 [Pisolithus thermaeus]
MGAEGAPQGGDRSTESGTSMPLCSIAVPQPWRLHLSRRERFKIIRDHFYTVADMHHTVGTEASHESADQRVTSGMVDMLVMFGLDYLQKLVGEITFFERLPSIMQALRRGEPSVEDDGSPTCLSSLSSVSSESWDSLDYVDLLSEWKGPRYETGTVHDVLRLRRDDAQYSLIKKEAKQHDLEFISVSLSTKLLEFVYVLSSEKWGDGDPLGHTDFDMALVHSTVQEVEALRTRLEATADDDEQRALEEDITGQILWFYWCGICSEVNDRLRSRPQR